MNGGEIIVHGHAGDILGMSARGGKIFVRDDVGRRAGIHTKEFKGKKPVVVIGGTAQDFLAEYMAGGTLLLLGLTLKPDQPHAASFIGTGMLGGVIYVRGTVEDCQLGKEVGQTADQFGVDFTFVPSERVDLTAGYIYEKYNFLMAAAYFPRGVTVPPNFNPKTDPNYWENATDDKVDTFRAGLDWALVPAKWDFNATFDYTKPRSDSVYDFDAPGTPVGGLNEANGSFAMNSSMRR